MKTYKGYRGHYFLYLQEFMNSWYLVIVAGYRQGTRYIGRQLLHDLICGQPTHAHAGLSGEFLLSCEYIFGLSRADFQSEVKSLCTTNV